MADSKGFIGEFKEFISRGNVMDMAVGIIIGGAFTAIVTSVVDDIIGPILGAITGGINFSEWGIKVGEANIANGGLIQAIINFLIVGLVLFSVIKAVNKARELKDGPAEEAAPTTKICPFCKSEINIEATRCPNCTSELQ